MPSNARQVARTVRVWSDQHLGPRAASRILAATARGRRDELIAAGDAEPTYRTFVDGREGASEDTVRPDGAILYKFSSVGQAATFALAYVIARSPRLSGDYRRNWIVAVNGRPWKGNLLDIPSGSTVLIVNPMPYARKVDVGAMKMRVPAGIIEGARQAVKQKYRAIDAERAFVDIPASFAPAGVEVPYVLRGHAHLVPVIQNRRSSAFRAGRLFRAPRPDTQRGALMTYPALILTVR